MLGYVQSKVLHTVNFFPTRRSSDLAQRSIRLVKTNKIACLDFVLGLIGWQPTEVKFDVRLRAIKSSAHRHFFSFAATTKTSPRFDSSARDEQNPVFRFFARPKGKGTL